MVTIKKYIFKTSLNSNKIAQQTDLKMGKRCDQTVSKEDIQTANRCMQSYSVNQQGNINQNINEIYNINQNFNEILYL